MATTRLIVYCESCHAVLESKASIRIGEGASVAVLDCEATCPQCGRMANVLNMIYSVVQETLTAITTQQLSYAQLRQVVEMLESAKKASSIDRIVDQAAMSTPPFTWLRDMFTRNKPWLAKEITKALVLSVITCTVNHCLSACHPNQGVRSVNIHNEVRVNLVVEETLRKLDPRVEIMAHDIPPTASQKSLDKDEPGNEEPR